MTTYNRAEFENAIEAYDDAMTDRNIPLLKLWKQDLDVMLEAAHVEAIQIDKELNQAAFLLVPRALQSAWVSMDHAEALSLNERRVQPVPDCFKVEEYEARAMCGKPVTKGHPAERLKITHTGLEVTTGILFAYFDGGQFEITQQARMNINWELRSGRGYEVSRQWFDNFSGIKYLY